jgi:hypothetical protein
MAKQSTMKEQRLDWVTAELHPAFDGGFKLVVEGIAAVPTKVRLEPLPDSGEARRGIEVIGHPTGIGEQVATPWVAEIATRHLNGPDGVELIGLSERRAFPVR